MKKRLSFLIVVLFIVLGAFYFMTRTSINMPPKSKSHSIHNPAFADALAKVNYIEQGNPNAPHKLYAIIDPNCHFCHALFEATQLSIEQGQLAVRWVVIGVVAPSSAYKAIAILDADNPLQALKQNEQGFNYDQNEGGITPISQPTSAQIAKLNQNVQALRNLIQGVPVIVYIDLKGLTALSGGPLLPMLPSEAAADNNRLKLINFLPQVSDKWSA